MFYDNNAPTKVAVSTGHSQERRCLSEIVFIMRLMRFIIFLAVLASTTAGRCHRQYEVSAGPDCSTIDNQCNYLYDSNNSFVSEIQFPPSNTRRCYRTCFQDGVCKASHANQNPRSLPLIGGFRHVFSPGHPHSNYRKSTNCRYSIMCNTSEWISISAVEFNLQNRVDCSSENNNVCVDFVEIVNYNTNEATRYCGNEHDGDDTVIEINYHQVTFEFSSNRVYQDDGFNYHVRCMSSDVTATAQSCKKPCGSRPIKFEPKRLAVNPNKQERHTVVKMTWAIIFRSSTIEVKDERNHTIRLFKGINQLDVEKAASKRLETYRAGKTVILRGYGILAIKQGRASYFLIGVNPLFKPSVVENVLIQKIEYAVDFFLGLQSFDVKDELDKEEDSSMFFSLRLSKIRRLRLSYHLPYINRLALWYSNACNPVLRKAACTYRKIVIGISCSTS